MDTPIYGTLARQSGLAREIQVIANNIANSATNGFRREGVVFEEYVAGLPGQESLSMAYGDARAVILAQGGLSQTGGTFDLGIQGEGFFLISTPQGDRLTRAGAFLPNSEGNLVTPDGDTLLDAGGAAVALPFGTKSFGIADDGTLSADGAPVAQIGLWQPEDPSTLRHEGGTLFSSSGVTPVEGSIIKQGFLEDSNVDPLSEIARMIEVQRAYEFGQKFLDAEDERQKNVIQTLGR